MSRNEAATTATAATVTATATAAKNKQTKLQQQQKQPHDVVAARMLRITLYPQQKQLRQQQLHEQEEEETDLLTLLHSLRPPPLPPLRPLPLLLLQYPTAPFPFQRGAAVSCLSLLLPRSHPHGGREQRQTQRPANIHEELTN